MDQSVCPSTPLTLSEELRKAFNERNILTTRSKMKVLTALNEYTKASKIQKSKELREKAINEIYTSEISYLKQLEVIMKFFMEPLKTKSWLPQTTFQALFGNIEIIYKMNGELLQELKKQNGNVGAAFNQLAPYLKLYSVYAYDYKQALQILQTMVKNNKELNDFIVKNETRPEVSATLQSLLIVPIQRIPRYKLLLQEVLNHTEVEHPEYFIIKDALRKIEEAASHTNDLVSQYENTESMLALARRLSCSPMNIIQPGRKIIKQGSLMKNKICFNCKINFFNKYMHNEVEEVIKKTSEKDTGKKKLSNTFNPSEKLLRVSKSGRTSNPRYLVLFTDSLMYCKGGEEGPLKFSGLFPVKYCLVEPILSTGVFKITCQNETLLLYTSDSKVGLEWITALQAAAKELQETRRTLRKESSKRKPLHRRGVLETGEMQIPKIKKSKDLGCFGRLRFLR